MKDERKIISIRIQSRLKDLGITQKDLAKKSGFSEVTISRWTNGKRIPNAMDCVSLCKVLHCSCDYLVGLSDSITTNKTIKSTRACDKSHIRTRKELITEDGKIFSLFSGISFNIYNADQDRLDRVICRIIGMDIDYITDNVYVIVDDVMINDCENGQIIFYIKDMKDINHVYFD